MSLSLADLRRAWYLQVLGYSVAQGAKFSNADLAYLVYSNPGVIGSSGSPTAIQSNYKAASNLTENYSRVLAGAQTTGNVTTGRLNMQAIYLTAGMSVTSVVYVHGNALPTTQTNLWAALWDPSGNKIAVSQDELTTMVSTLTEKVFVLAGGPFVIPTNGMYYSSYTWVGTGTPNLLGTASHNSVNGLLPIITGNNASGMTTPSVAPGSVNVTTTTPQNTIPYVQVR